LPPNDIFSAQETRQPETWRNGM